MRIKIISCTKDKYIIEPIKEQSLSMYSSKDLSIELKNLKIELAKINLEEGRDYVVDRGPWPNTEPYYQVKFSGKSQVLRGLFTIPIEWINFNQCSIDYTSKQSPNGYFKRNRLVFAMNILPQECSVPEVNIVEEANAQLYQEVVKEINAIHGDIKTPSLVIDQLNQDIKLISQRKDNIWGDSNFKLLCAALRHARDLIEINQKKASNLYIKYAELFDNCRDFLGNCRGFITPYGNAAYAFLEENYYPLVKALEKNQNVSFTNYSF